MDNYNGHLEFNQPIWMKIPIGSLFSGETVCFSHSLVPRLRQHMMRPKFYIRDNADPKNTSIILNREVDLKHDKYFTCSNIGFVEGSNWPERP
jgi:hypothetical protein